MSDKIKHPRERALAVAEKIVEALRPVCSRIEIAGSIRRRKPMVGDVEILFIPKFVEVPDPQSLFGTDKIRVSAPDLIIAELIERGSLAKRPKTDGSFTWGEWIKLAVAVKTSIPVDFFATTEQAWWSSLVCRTGGADSNTRIATAALRKGWAWNMSPDNGGFTNHTGNSPERFHAVGSEREVFAFVGLPYLEPHERT